MLFVSLCSFWQNDSILHQYKARVFNAFLNIKAHKHNRSEGNTEDYRKSALSTPACCLPRQHYWTSRTRCERAFRTRLYERAVKASSALRFETRPRSCVIMRFTRISECDHVRSAFSIKRRELKRQTRRLTTAAPAPSPWRSQTRIGPCSLCFSEMPVAAVVSLTDARRSSHCLSPLSYATRSPAEGGVRVRWRRSLTLKEPAQLHLCQTHSRRNRLAISNSFVYCITYFIINILKIN